jgi:hypothetical protein
MANTMQLSDLRTAVRQRADIVGSQFVTDSELTSYINQSYLELYDLLVQKYGDDYFVASPYTITTDGINDTFTLPTDFQKFLGLDLALSTSQDSYVTIRRFEFQDRNRYAVPNFQSFYGVTNLRYRLRGNSLWLTPIPSSGQTLRLFYVPQLTLLSADSDLASNLGGWLEYVIVDAAIKCMQKEESDISALMAQKQALIVRIEAAAENRDAGNPPRVADGQSSDWSWPSGNGSGFGGSF